MPSTLLLATLTFSTVITAAACLDNHPEARSLPDGAADAGLDAHGDSGAGDSARGSDIRLPLAPLEATVEGRFATSLKCNSCHANVEGAQGMRDDKARPVAPYDLWQATAMANAGRDPLWRAAVAAEVAAMPDKKADVEAQCLRCHAPMAYTEASNNGETPISMALLAQNTPRSQLALDGVSCALCHQIEATDLGQPTSFSGGFSVGDDKIIYGPHTGLFASPMIGDSGGFEARTSPHILQPGLCASCHTLFVDSHDKAGKPTGKTFPEQTPYLEWRNSVFNTEVASPSAQAKSCQGCHMPQQSEDGTPISTQVALQKNGTDYNELVVPKRSPYGRHLFIGGNTLLPTWLKTFRDELSPVASDAAFDALIGRARKQLTERTATLTIDSANRSGDTLTVAVTAKSLAGHKLPTGYPARRVVLQLVVEAGNETLFSSGAFDSQGRLLDASGAVLPAEGLGGVPEPHHQTITSGDQVQIYEAVLAGSDGKPTYHLLQASSYAKDNRLLPLGWRSDHADIGAIAPAGLGGDQDFVAGGDTVRYQITLPAGQTGPLQVKAALYYQPLSPRHAAELMRSRVPEVLVLERMLARTGFMPELITSASQEVL